MVGFLLLTRCFHIFGQASVTVVKSVAYVLLLHTGSKRGGNTLTKGFAGIWKKKRYIFTHLTRFILWIETSTV